MLLTDTYLMNFTRWWATVKGRTDVKVESGKKRVMEKKNDFIGLFLQKTAEENCCRKGQQAKKKQKL